MRQINFGLYFFVAAERTRGTRRRILRFSRAADIAPHLFGFMLFQ